MITYTIRKNEYGEYVVRFRKNGVRIPEWDYFTDDKSDAIDTARFTAGETDPREAFTD